MLILKGTQDEMVQRVAQLCDSCVQCNGSSVEDLNSLLGEIHSNVDTMNVILIKNMKRR
jgi:hypothetical protein